VTVCGQLDDLGMYYVKSHLGQLSPPYVQCRLIEYQPYSGMCSLVFCGR